MILMFTVLATDAQTEPVLWCSAAPNSPHSFTLLPPSGEKLAVDQIKVSSIVVIDVDLCTV